MSLLKRMIVQQKHGLIVCQEVQYLEQFQKLIYAIVCIKLEQSITYFIFILFRKTYTL